MKGVKIRLFISISDEYMTAGAPRSQIKFLKHFKFLLLIAMIFSTSIKCKKHSHLGYNWAI